MTSASAASRLAAVSIDLDEIPCYSAIHGLPFPEDERAHAIYDRALPRLLEWLAERDVRATLFVVARDLERPEVVRALRGACAAGHEVASHSYSHFYDLVRRDDATLEDEVRRATRTIAEAVGVRPVGFRAPGYTLSEALLDTLVADGYRYDSSLFPCPAYYAAKALAMAAMRARGRRSRSILDDPRMLLGPGDPYRVGRRRWERGQGLLELPIGVLPERWGRLPYIGTSVILAGPRGARFLDECMAERSFVGLELHGIDLADARADDLGFLLPHQPDLRHDLAHKRASLSAALEPLRQRGFRFVTLAEAAAERSH